MNSCVPQINHDLNSDAVSREPSARVHKVPGFGQANTMTDHSSTLREMITRAQSVSGDELVLDVVYIMERIISMSFPAEGHESTYRYNLKEVAHMLKTKHGDNYLILNISDKRDDLTKMNFQVLDFGWPDHLAPPLERLCSICKSIDSWLNSDPNHVIVLHCKGGWGRISVIIAAYMHYCNICASADQALDRFTMKRFYDDKLGGLPQPSQRRYVHYFAGLLSGAIKINSRPLYLHHILIHGVPNFDTRGGCRPFIKVYQGIVPIFTSGVYNVTDNMQKVCISISPGIPLRGDILIKCYHKKLKTGQREVIWRCQFHTCAIADYNLVFSKQELDDAQQDPRFPDPAKVEFVFGGNSEGAVRVSGFKSDVTVPVDDGTDALVRWDSYENFNSALDGVDGVTTDVNENGISPQAVKSFRLSQVIDRTQGPVDGNLYAQVGRKKQETSMIVQNGTMLQNGSHSSVDSGISASSGMMGTTAYSSSPPYSGKLNANEKMQHSYGSTVTSSKMSYGMPSTAQNKPVKAMDEQTQLDQILSDLLNEQINVTTTHSKSALPESSETKSFKTWDAQTGQHGEVAFRIPLNVSTTKSKSVSEETSRPYIPNSAFTYTPPSPEFPRSHKPEISTKTQTLPYRTDYDNRYNTDSYSYTFDSSKKLPLSEQEMSPWLEEQKQKLRYKQEGGEQRSEQDKMLVQELKTAQNKYYTNRAKNEADEKSVMNSYHTSPPPLVNGPTSPPGSYNYSVSRSHTYSTSDPPPAGLIHHGFSGDAQTSYSTKSYSTESQSYGNSVANKPPPSPVLQRSVTPTSAPPVPPPPRASSKDYMQQQRLRSGSSSSWQSHSRPLNRQHSDSSYDREVAIERHPQNFSMSPPAHSPRSFSPTQGYQSSNWRTQKTTQQVGRDQTDFGIVPPMSPTSPTVTEVRTPDGRRQHYVTEVFVHRGGSQTPTKQVDIEIREKPERERNRLDELEKSLQAASASIMASQPSWDEKREDTVTRRVEAHRYEMHQQPQQHQQQQQQKQQWVAQESVSSYHDMHPQHRSMSPVWDNVYLHGGVIQEPPPPAKQVREIVEDQISLQPIGLGVHTLEPDGPPMGTLGRPTTPGFPTPSPMASAATPPFPATPRTAYVNAAPIPSPRTPVTPSGMADRDEAYNQIISRQLVRCTDPLYASIPEDMGGTSSSHVTSMGSTSQVVSPSVVPEIQHVQYPTSHQQQQQVQSQHYQTQTQQQQQHQHQQQQYSNTSQDGSLHVDTSAKPLSPRSPSSAGSPQSPGSLNTLRQQLQVTHHISGGAMSPGQHSLTGQSSPSVYFGLSRRGSLSSLTDSEAVNTTPRFVKDTSKYWYKPFINREEAIVILKDRQPGTFIVRDSSSFPGAFGLALKVATVPPNVQTKSTGNPATDLVRHFLIEPTPNGVRLRGCSNEPVFGSLAALVYQHSITPLALPCKLLLPEADPSGEHGPLESPLATDVPNSAAALLAQGAACNVLYLNSIDTESLTGPQAVARAIKLTLEAKQLPSVTTAVHFKVSNQGITLTDNKRKLFFRRHYPVSCVTYCGTDPEDRKWKRETDTGVQVQAKIFGFVARKQGSVSDNACHIFAELDPDQPAAAIVNFVTKVMIGKVKT